MSTLYFFQSALARKVRKRHRTTPHHTTPHRGLPRRSRVRHYGHPAKASEASMRSAISNLAAFSAISRQRDRGALPDYWLRRGSYTFEAVTVRAAGFLKLEHGQLARRTRPRLQSQLRRADDKNHAAREHDPTQCLHEEWNMPRRKTVYTTYPNLRQTSTSIRQSHVIRSTSGMLRAAHERYAVAHTRAEEKRGT